MGFNEELFTLFKTTVIDNVMKKYALTDTAINYKSEIIYEIKRNQLIRKFKKSAQKLNWKEEYSDPADWLYDLQYPLLLFTKCLTKSEYSTINSYWDDLLKFADVYMASNSMDDINLAFFNLIPVEADSRRLLPAAIDLFNQKVLQNTEYDNQNNAYRNLLKIYFTNVYKTMNEYCGKETGQIFPSGLWKSIETGRSDEAAKKLNELLDQIDLLIVSMKKNQQTKTKKYVFLNITYYFVSSNIKQLEAV